MGSIGFVKNSGKINNSLDRWIAHRSGQHLGGESGIGQLKHSLIGFDAELKRHALQSLLENRDKSIGWLTAKLIEEPIQ
ncbi:MAG: hypothetical protein RLZZ206_1408 [Cyanobacteriota bacterium]